MLKDVVSAVYKGEYKIEVTFEDGVSGIVDFAKYLRQGGIFEKFKDIEYFKNFTINRELGVLTWGGRRGGYSSGNSLCRSDEFPSTRLDEPSGGFPGGRIPSAGLVSSGLAVGEPFGESARSITRKDNYSDKRSR